MLTGIDGEVTLAGGAGTDSVVLDASGSLADLAGVVRATTVTGFGMPGTVTYGTAEALSVLLGSGDFHHLSLPLVELEARRQRSRAGSLRVVVLDNHPDNMRFPLGVHCGSWVGRAAALPGVVWTRA